MNLPHDFFSKRNLATFLIIGILVLSVPLGIQIVQKQQILNSKAEQTANACTNHQPHSPSYYDTFESPDRFGNEIRDKDTGKVIGRTEGWKEDVGHLHLNGMYAWGETDRNPDGSQINPSYKLTYREVINNPCFSYAVKTMDEFFDIPNLKTGSAGRTYCDEASYDPGLGRGDPRKFDPAERVTYYMHAPRSHVDPPTGRQTSQTDNPAGDPVAWLVNNGYWSKEIYYYDVGSPGKPKPSVCLAIPGTAVSKPTNLTATCSADNRTATLNWSADGAKFDLRADGPVSYPAQANNCSPHNICLNDFASKTITVNITGSGTISYWLNAKNAAGAPGETSDIKIFSCAASTSSSSPPANSSISPSPSSLTCDFNKDGNFDDKDFKIWVDEFTGQKRTRKADCNGDLRVDLLDFNMWRDQKLEREE